MPVITLPAKRIRPSNIHQLLQEPAWSFRHVCFDEDLESSQSFGDINGSSTVVPRRELIPRLIKHIVEHVETMSIRKACPVLRDSVDGHLQAIRFRLKKLTIRDTDFIFAGNDAVLSAPSLVELKMCNVAFRSAESVEHFFATAKTLKTLVLDKVTVSGDSTRAKTETAQAFRQGLKRNHSLREVSVNHRTGEDDELLLRECLMGIMENIHVREFSLELCSISRGFNEPSEQTSQVVQQLVSGTISIQKLSFQGSAALIQIFQGLASNSSILQVEFRVFSGGQFRHHEFRTYAALDARLAEAITECFRNNKTLRSCSLVGIGLGARGFGPQSRMAVATGLSQSASLEEFSADGTFAPPEALQHLSKLRSASLPLMHSPDWRFLSRGMVQQPEDGRQLLAQEESKLQELNLGSNTLTGQNLEIVLPCLSRGIQELSLNRCSIGLESVPLLCDFIRNTPLKKLSLGWNCVSTAGAAIILDAISSSCPTMEYLDMEGPCFDLQNDGRRMEMMIDLNECHESLCRLLQHSPRLLYLNMVQFEPLGLECIRSLASGLRENSTLKFIRLPFVKREFLHILGEALTKNRSLESLRDSYAHHAEVLSEAEEDAMISFTSVMPQMKSLVRIDSIFERQATERLQQALIAAMKENTVLRFLQRDKVKLGNTNHMCNHETVEFYLQLNQLGRHHYLAAPESKQIPPVLLPHLFARMAKPEYTGHLYYFIRHTSPDVLVPEQAWSFRRRKATVSPSGNDSG